MSKFLRIEYFCIFLLLFSTNVSAINCDDPSPNLINEGDKYYDIPEVQPLSREQKTAINMLFASLKGELNGAGTTTFCEGATGEQKKVIARNSLSANVGIDSSGLLTISLVSFDIKSKTSLNETLMYFGVYNQHVIQYYSDNELVINTKYRKPGGKRSASILHEEIITIRAKNRGINMKTTRYINGYFAIEYDRTMK